MKLLRLRARYRRWCAERKLERSGYSSWAHYRHNRDPDVNPRASTVTDFYHGYKFIHRCENPYAYKMLWDAGPGGLRFGYDEMTEWCDTNIRFKYRRDCHRCLEQHRLGRLGVDGEEYVDWHFNDIGGSDFVWFAFKDEADYFKFLLVWA